MTTGSVDTISLVQEIRSRPSDQNLFDMGFRYRKGKFSPNWFHIGGKASYEPKLTLYSDYRNKNRLKAQFSIPRLTFGNNLQLPDQEQINAALKSVSGNVSDRIGFKFDAPKATVHRIDYSYNLFFEPMDVTRIIQCYSQYQFAHLKREVYPNETVYFRSQSKAIRMYDKYRQILKTYPNAEEILQAANGLIRLEYYFLRRAGIMQLAKRLGFADTTANTLLLERNIQTVTNDLLKVVNIEMIDLSDHDNFTKIHLRTNDLKKTITLFGFIEAFNKFGEEFYRNPELKYSESTYNRMRGEIQSLGIPF